LIIASVDIAWDGYALRLHILIVILRALIIDESTPTLHSLVPVIDRRRVGGVNTAWSTPWILGLLLIPPLA
jgi:hypothetical protein